MIVELQDAVARGTGRIVRAGHRLASRWGRPGPERVATTLRLAGAPSAPEPPFVPAAKVTDLIGPGVSDRYTVGGTDLGAPVLTPDGRLLLVFGDTFSTPGTVDGKDWRTPTALYADPGTVQAGLRWTGAAPGRDGSDERAGQLVPQDHRSTIRGSFITTQLPSDVVLVDGVLYLQVMACEGLGNPHFTELYASHDQGRTWATTGCWWPADHWNGWFQSLSFCPGDDGYLYCVSTGFQRDKGLMLSRVPTDRITDPDAWQPWGPTGPDQWGWGAPPAFVLPGRFGELSLRRLGDRWVLSAFNDVDPPRIEVRVLAGPTDDMTRAPVATVAHHVPWGQEDHARGLVAQPYAGFVLPGSTLEDMHLVISQWHVDPPGEPYRSMQFRVDLSVLDRAAPA